MQVHYGLVGRLKGGYQVTTPKQHGAFREQVQNRSGYTLAHGVRFPSNCPIADSLFGIFDISNRAIIHFKIVQIEINRYCNMVQSGGGRVV